MSRLNLDPADLGDSMLVSFAVRRLRSARVLWLNERWMLQNGLDPFSSSERSKFVSTLLTNFGVAAVVDGAHPAEHGELPANLYADRYGSSDGTSFGGSGRCGSKDGFIAKGIGRTPLISKSADARHRTGLMSLAEAFKEAMCSEIAFRELPWGAVPVVAIIDADFKFTIPGDTRTYAAGIVIRPSFVRPAHFERSIFFGAAGSKDSEQFQDAVRVKTAIRRAVERPDIYPSITETFLRLAQQIGAARALRLWGGRVLTSNFSIDGAYADFGAFRSMPNWRISCGLAGECFGAEQQQLQHAFLSVAGYFAKYAPATVASLDVRAFVRQLHETERRAFISTCVDSLGADKGDGSQTYDELAGLIAEYLALQLTSTVGMNVSETYPWIYDAFQERRALGNQASMAEQSVTRKIARLITSRQSLRPTEGISVDRAVEFFGPRSNLSYGVIGRKTQILETILDGDKLSGQHIASQFMNRQISKCVLWSRLIPKEFEVLAATSDVVSDVLRCRHRVDGELSYWVRTHAHRETIPLAANIADCEDPKLAQSPHKKGCIVFRVPISEASSGALTIGGRALRLAHA